MALSTACPKPERGTQRKAFLTRRASRRTLEKEAKALVRQRDGGHCRVPGCQNLKRGWAWNCAHLEHKGMGGNKTMDRTDPKKLIGLCHLHHMGPHSLDSGDLKIEPETAHGTHGLCHFLLADEQRQWVSLGVG